MWRALSISLLFTALMLPQSAQAGRLFTTGYEWQSVTNGVDLFSVDYGTAVISTAIKHSGAASARWNGIGQDGSVALVYPMVNAAGGEMYARTYVYVDSLPTGGNIVPLAIGNVIGGTPTAIEVTFWSEGSNMSVDVTPYDDEGNPNPTSDVATLSFDTWYRLEIYLDDNGTDSYSVRIDGVQVNSGSAATLWGNSDPSEWWTYSFGGNDVLTESAFQIYFDDVAINNTSGSFQNSWPGAGNVALLVPNGAGDSSCTIGDFSMINEVPPSDTETSGVTMCELNNNGDIGRFNVTDSSTAGIDSFDTITLVEPRIRINEQPSAATSYNLRVRSASGGTESTSSSVDAGNATPATNPSGATSPFGLIFPVYVDPTTSVAWTPTGTNSIDNMQIGVANADAAGDDLRITTYATQVEYVDGVDPGALPESNTLIKPPNNLGLIGYWSFNEATSTVAGDYSGNRNNGTLEGNAHTRGFGRLGTSLVLDGNGDRMSIPDPNTLDVANISVCAWARRTGAGDGLDYQVIATKQEFPNAGFILFFDSPEANEIAFETYENGTTFNTSATIPENTSWHHYCGVLDDTGANQYIYMDGVLLDSNPIGGISTANTADFYIGTDDGGTGDFQGNIDEVRIYNRALTAAQVRALYNGGTTGAVRLNASSKTLTDGTTLDRGLLGHWSFDGGDVRWTSGTAGNVLDSSGGNNFGVMTNMSRAASAVIGKLGQGLLFDNTDDFVIIDDSDFSLSTVIDLSMAFWVKKNSYSGVDGLVTKGGGWGR